MFHLQFNLKKSLATHRVEHNVENVKSPHKGYLWWWFALNARTEQRPLFELTVVVHQIKLFFLLTLLNSKMSCDKTYHSLRKWPTEGEAVSAIWRTLALIHSNGFQNVQIDINKPQFDIENENAPEAEAESRQNVKFAIFKHCEKYENTQRGLRLRMQMLLIRGSALCIR